MASNPIIFDFSFVASHGRSSWHLPLLELCFLFILFLWISLPIFLLSGLVWPPWLLFVPFAPLALFFFSSFGFLGSNLSRSPGVFVSSFLFLSFSTPTFLIGVVDPGCEHLYCRVMRDLVADVASRQVALLPGRAGTPKRMWLRLAKA